MPWSVPSRSCAGSAKARPASNRAPPRRGEQGTLDQPGPDLPAASPRMRSVLPRRAARTQHTTPGEQDSMTRVSQDKLSGDTHLGWARCLVTDISAHLLRVVLWGSPACSATLHQMPSGELLQHISVGVVLVVAAALTPAVEGPAASRNTCGVTTRFGSLADLLRPSRRLIYPGLDPQRSSDLGGPDLVASDQRARCHLNQGDGSFCADPAIELGPTRPV